MSVNSSRLVVQLCGASAMDVDARQALALARAFRRRGDEAVVFAAAEGALARAAEAAGLEVETFSFDGGWLPARGWRLASALRRRGAGVLHVHGDAALEAADWAARFGRFRIIVAFRRSDPPPGTTLRRLRRSGRGIAAATAAAAAVCASPAVGLPAERLWDGVEPEMLALADTPPAARDALRERLRAAYCPGVKKPLFLLYLDPRPDAGPGAADREGVSRLFPVMEKILARLPQTRLLLAGPALSADAEANELAVYARELAVDEGIVFAGESHPAADLLRAADVFVWSDRAGMETSTVADAMAAGLPVAAAGAGNLSEWVETEKTGLLADVDDIDALTAAVKRLLEERNLRGHYGRAGRALARRRSADALAERLAAMYWA